MLSYKLGSLHTAVQFPISTLCAHSWHWFPEMTRDEVLLFAQFCSHDERCSRMLHTAVHLPKPGGEGGGSGGRGAVGGGGGAAEPRHSCEMRLLCLLPPG